MRLAPLLRAAALVLLPLVASAQGSISNQGFGYPAGGLSGPGAAMAGANAELDPNSAVNPAALPRVSRYAISMRFEPEFRRTDVGAISADAAVLRFPSFLATGAFGRFVGAAGVSTMLDRSWRTRYDDTQFIFGEPVLSTIQVGVEGAMSDARVALSYVVGPRVQVGAAIHAIVGENRVSFERSFDENSGVATIVDNPSLGFTGTAVSLGLVLEPVDDVVISGSARFGREMKLEQQGVEVGRATVPSRMGLGLAYTGISGLSLFGRVDRTSWTDLEGLGSDSLAIFDATELSVGAEALGPRLFGVNASIRGGLRQRSLPFGVAGREVEERGFAFGIGVPLSRGRTALDIGAQRLRRSVAGAEENSWVVSIGLGIRP